MIITAIQTHQSTLIFQIICFFALFSNFLSKKNAKTAGIKQPLQGIKYNIQTPKKRISYNSLSN